MPDLASLGYELEHPHRHTLREGIYALRKRYLKKRYRMLYFFVGRGIACMSHGIVKKTKDVPDEDIELAIKRKKLVEKDLDTYTALWTQK